jgi:hypothetical protein
MSTAGARYLAESEQWLAAEREARTSPQPPPNEAAKPKVLATAPLFEVAAFHDGQPPADWLRVMKWRLYGQD